MDNQSNTGDKLSPMENVARLATLHSNPLLALRAYASALSPSTEEGKSPGGGVGDVNGQEMLPLADFVLRCNGFALKMLQSSPMSVGAVRDYFDVALSGLLPRIFGKHSTYSSSSVAPQSLPRAEGDGGEAALDQEAEGDEESGRLTPLRAAMAYLDDSRLLEYHLQELLSIIESGARMAAGTTEFILLSLTLANWACVEMRYRHTARAYSLLRCCGIARRCTSEVSLELAHSGSSQREPDETHSSSGESEEVQREREAFNVTYQSWGSNAITAAAFELNDCAQQLMLCNCPEALDCAHSALAALEDDDKSKGTNGGEGGTIADERLLQILSFFAAGVAEEYENAERALAAYNAAIKALTDTNVVGPGTTALSFEKAAMRYRIESLLAQMNERLSRFVAKARAKAAAATAVTDMGVASLGRGKKGRPPQNASGKGRKTSVATNTSHKKSRTRSKPALSSAGQELVLEVPPIDSTLRASIRRFGLPVAVFGVLSLDAALELLVPSGENRGWVSPFHDVQIGEKAQDHIAIPATAQLQGEDAVEGNQGVEAITTITTVCGGGVRWSERPLCVAAVMVCTETPLQWALEATALAANPPAPRYSVWTSPPLPLATHHHGFARAEATDCLRIHTHTEMLRPLSPEESITRNRLARFLLLASKYEYDEDFEEDARHGFARLADAHTLTTTTNSRGETTKKLRGHGEGPGGFLAAALGPPPPASTLDGAKKGVANAVKLLSNRLNNLLKAEKAFENCWTATDKVKSALMSYYVPQQLAKLKATLLEKKRFETAREDYCARVLVRFFRHVVQEKPRLQGFLSLDERRAREEERAAVTLQKYARRWLAQQIRKALEAKRTKGVASVTLVQSMYRRRKATRRVEAIRNARMAIDAEEGEEDRRCFAAIQIQRMYRGHAARLDYWIAIGQHDRALRNHLHDSRHWLVTQIQKRVRGMLTRRKHGAAVNARRYYGRNSYRAKVLTESSVTIQRYYRGYRVRRQLFEAARALRQNEERSRNTGYFFKRYLGPGAITVTAASLREGGGVIEIGPADAITAAAPDVESSSYDGLAVGDCGSIRNHKKLSAADHAAIKIQSAYRRWAAICRVEKMLISRRAAVAARRGEKYKPFLVNEYVF